LHGIPLLGNSCNNPADISQRGKGVAWISRNIPSKWSCHWSTFTKKLGLHKRGFSMGQHTITIKHSFVKKLQNKPRT